SHTIYWIPVSIILIVVLGFIIKKPMLANQWWLQLLLILLIFLQQLAIEHVTFKKTIEPYQSTMKDINDPSYRGHTLNDKIQQIK
ncbi:hypothetical protein WL241_12250, partial [Staphylococcus epidermidis]